MVNTTGLFSPIEDVVREAEERAEREWRREHEPCPHNADRLRVLERCDALCTACHQWVDDD